MFGGKLTGGNAGDGRVRQGLEAFLERHGDRAAETLWWSALAILDRAVEDAAEGKWGRWRFYPAGELRRLRRDLAEGLELARLAVALQEEENESRAELDAELREAAAEAGRKRRRQGTLEAERVRLDNARRRREGS